MVFRLLEGLRRGHEDPIALEVWTCARDVDMHVSEVSLVVVADAVSDCDPSSRHVLPMIVLYVCTPTLGGCIDDDPASREGG